MVRSVLGWPCWRWVDVHVLACALHWLQPGLRAGCGGGEHGEFGEVRKIAAPGHLPSNVKLDTHESLEGNLGKSG